ncbi:thiamine-monophosphate kinase [Kovacikia minuta]|uniref:thiamine-monophosphate kinase n=1 Tax=Kovacikia minuta TaxID=2931930 RepID=UPI001CED249E
MLTSDMLVDGVHFSDRTTTPEDAGWRAAAANLSDLAAMGATPLGLTVALGVPGEVTVDWVERLYQGLTACLQQYQTPIVGGDVCRSPIRTIAITAFGEAAPHQIMRRSTAQPGDAILVTGFHGASRAGLELLLHPERGQSLNSGDRAALIQAHQRANPRLDVLPLLQKAEGRGQGAEGGNQELGVRSQESGVRSQESVPIQNSKLKIQNSKFKPPPYPTPYTPHPITAMDSSDGLADAVIQICRASRVGARVERSQIPLPAGLETWVGAAQSLDWALYGGEDFELVLCLGSTEAGELLQQLGKGAAIVGTITNDSKVWLVDAANNQPAQPLNLDLGFQHFGSDASE